MSWTEYQESTYRTKPNYLTVYLANNLSFNTVIDLGCGSGNDTVYLLKKGKKVTAIDAYLNEDYILNRITNETINNLTMIKDTMENIQLPKSDVILSLFVLPFCNPSQFNEVWQKVTSSINKNGYLVSNLFGERDHHKEFNRPTFTKDEVLDLLKDFEIIKWKEQEYTRESDNTHWHYYDFIARKK